MNKKLLEPLLQGFERSPWEVRTQLRYKLSQFHSKYSSTLNHFECGLPESETSHIFPLRLWKCAVLLVPIFIKYRQYFSQPKRYFRYAAAAKSLQSCPTLCDPIDSSPPGSPVPAILQARNTGVGCHFLLQYMKVKSENEVAQSCLTLSDSMNCSLPGSSAHGIFQARLLKWGAIAFSDFRYNRY